MDYHHARTTVHGREYLAKSVVEGRLSLCEAAAECRLSRQSAGKWVMRYREAGVAGGGPQLTSEAVSAQHLDGTGSASGVPAPGALDRRADRTSHRS
jgi:hypothetical protein